MSLFRSFYYKSFDTKCPGLKQKKNDNNTLCPHRFLLRQTEWWHVAQKFQSESRRVAEGSYETFLQKKVLIKVLAEKHFQLILSLLLLLKKGGEGSTITGSRLMPSRAIGYTP